MSAPRSKRALGRWSFIAALCAGLCLGQPSADAGDIDFYQDIYPILKSNCIACHNKTTTKAALNMESPESMRKGGDSGEGIIPGNAAESLIYQAAAHTEDVEMPPKGNKSGALNFNTGELAMLKGWIDQGAKSSVKQARPVVWRPLPPGVNPIYSVAMTRDGRFAACGRANQIFVYDLATRQLATRLADQALDNPAAPQTTGVAHKSLVQSLAFSPDGMRLASGGFREVKIWRRENSPGSTRKGDPAVGATVSALSSDGKRLVSADKMGVLTVLDTATGKTIKTFQTDKHESLSLLIISQDASKAALSGIEGELTVWNLADGRLIASDAAQKGLRALAWTPDGKAIATGGGDKAARLWPLPEADPTKRAIAREFKGAGGAITAIASGATHLIAASADGKVYSWSMSEPAAAGEFAASGVVALTLSGDGAFFAAGRADGVVQVWDRAAGKPLIELTGDLETSARLAELDGLIATEGLETAFQNQEVSRVQTQGKALEERLKNTNETIATLKKDLVETQNALKQATAAKEAARKDTQEKLTAAELTETVALSAFNALEIHLKDAVADALDDVASQSRNKAALDAANAALSKAKAAQDKGAADAAEIKNTAAARRPRPLALRFSADAKAIAAASNDGSLRVWAIATGLPIAQMPGVGMTASASLAVRDDGVFEAVGGDGSTILVHTPSRWVLERTLGGETAASPFIDRVNALRFSPDGKLLAAGGGEPTRSGDITLWDSATGNLVKDWREKHSDAVLSLDFSADGKQLASGGADKLARVTEIAGGKSVHVFEGHTHHVMGVSFRADGRVLATAGGDGAVVVWDMISGERQRKIEGWSKEVTSLQFLGATNQILASSGDNRVRIVDDQGGSIRDLANLADFMQSAAGAATADVIIGGGEDGILRVWTKTTGQELATFGADSNTAAR